MVRDLSCRTCGFGGAEWAQETKLAPNVNPTADPVTSAPVLSGNARLARIAGLLVGGAAAVCMAAVGCTAVTEGDPTANSGDAPAYRTSMSASSSQSAASSSARESQRQASMTTRAVHSTCETLSTTSADAIDAVNVYVSAFNEAGGNTSAAEGPAVDSLNQSADAVESSISDIVPAEVKDAFMEWVDGARTTADAITRKADPSEFNQVIDDLNAARSDVLRLCDATY
jgi:hypothetical protein